MALTETPQTTPLTLGGTFSGVNVRVIDAGSLNEFAQLVAADEWRAALDTETEFREELTTDGIPGRVRVISVATRQVDGSEMAFVIDLRDTPAEQVAKVLADADVVAWNANFDEHALSRSGITVGSWYDAMIADSVMRAGRHDVFWYRSLAVVAKQLIGFDVEGKGSTQLSYDLTSDLTDEQIIYAAQDAVVTRRVADIIRQRVTAHGLDAAVDLENGARPFINAMMIHGVPFDLDGYLDAQISTKEAEIADCLERLAALTEAAEPDPVERLDLFDSGGDEEADDGFVRPKPAWNPNSKADLIEVLNKWATKEVNAYTGGRLLTAADPLRKDDLKQIGGPICDVMLKLKAATKEVSTYGGDLRKHWRDGRFFSRYKQALVSTGRLASFNFNAQNMSKPMLGWMKAPQGRALVYGDAGQAELRVVAHLSGDTDMLGAFASGEDFHMATAKSMFPNEDLDAMVTEDPDTMKKRRTAAKAVNFGLAYGMAANLLAKNLTVAGVPTSPDEAQGYLKAYFAARPTMAEWMTERDNHVRQMSNRCVEGIDWPATIRLYELRSESDPARRQLKRAGEPFTMRDLAEKAWPEPEGVAEDARADFWDARTAELEWAWAYEGAVVLGNNGQPIGYQSSTASGRIRNFDVPMGNQGNDKFSGVIVAALLDMCGTKKPGGRAYVDEFAAEHNLKLPDAALWRKSRMQARVLTVKAFEGQAGRVLRWKFITGAIDRFGLTAMQGVLTRAAADCTRATRNAYRNHPVQGTVADIMELAFARIWQGLPAGAFPVLSVHDSVVIECDEADAEHVALLVRESIEGAMSHFCPNVVPSADVDIRTSLADADVIAEVIGNEIVPVSK